MGLGKLFLHKGRNKEIHGGKRGRESDTGEAGRRSEVMRAPPQTLRGGVSSRVERDLPRGQETGHSMICCGLRSVTCTMAP